MDPILLGYFPKELFAPPDRLRARGVEEIGSVSLCMAAGPDGWLEAWKHNDWGFFANPQIAWSLVPADKRADYWLYAYALYPIEYGAEGARPLETTVPGVLPLGLGYEQVGFDVVSRSTAFNFECSPLSCNMLAEEMAVNRFCLFSDLDHARELALAADEMGCEPGPYYVLQVWRERGVRRAP